MMRTGTVLAAGVLVLSACDQAMMTETADVDSGLPSPAQSMCMSAVAEETGNLNVTVLSAQSSRAGTEVVIGVGEERAPWRCRASADGTVEEVSSLAGEAVL